MSGETEKNHEKYFAGVKENFRRKKSVWSAMNHLKTEAEASRSKIQLIQIETEKIRESAGAAAYELWKAGRLQESALTEFFETIKKNEAGIEEENRSVLALEQQMEELRGEKKTENPQKNPSENSGELPIVCKACGARYREKANFCRKCGTVLREEEEEKEE